MNYRQGDNPARWAGNLKELLPAPEKVKSSKNHAVLPYQEAPHLIDKLMNKDSVSAKALAFCLLTTTRTNEIREMKWSEIDMKSTLWTIPAARMKVGKEHIIPLSKVAIQILEKLPRETASEYVFIGGRAGRPLSNMAMLKLLKADQAYENYTVYGLRSTFRDWGGRTDRSRNRNT